MKLVVDIGNTVAKVAVFDGDEIVDLNMAESNLYDEVRKKLVSFSSINSSIISSVADHDPNLENLLSSQGNFIKLSHTTKVPFINKYATPKTLGIDRIAIASAAVQMFKGENVLVIDIGTCTTFDFINRKGEYLGGAISPGLSLRFKSLHEFTHKLPMVKIPPHNMSVELIGTSTEESILSGVMVGMKLELESVINQYEELYSPLKIILSGGDHKYFDSLTKNNIFATPNIVVHGLKRILDFNEEN